VAVKVDGIYLTSHTIDRYCLDLKEEIKYAVLLFSFLSLPYNGSCCSYMLLNLPEGGEGSFGYDDGEGDD